MPRPASKSRGEKQEEGRSSVQSRTPLVQDQVGDENFPGSLYQNELTDEKVVTEIMDDLMAKVMDGCFQVYIETQSGPFFTFWAKSYITDALERQFICLDESEQLDDATRIEDAEPMPVTIDAWTQGCVPVQKATHHHDPPALHQETIMDSVPAEKHPTVNLQSDVLVQKIILPMQDEEDRSPKEPAIDKHFQRERSFPPIKKERKNFQIIISPKEVPDKLLSCSTKDTVDVENQNITSSASSLMSIPSQSHKKTLTVPKLHASSLPRHLIFPRYEIVETSDAKTGKKMQGRRSRKK